MLKNEFRQFRCTLSRHYKKQLQEGSGIRENLHPQVKQEDWENFCTWFESEKFQFFQIAYVLLFIVYGKMLEFQVAPTPEGSLPLTEAQTCEIILGGSFRYIKVIGRGYENPISSNIEYNTELVEAIRRADKAEKTNKELEEILEGQHRTIEELTAGYQGYHKHVA
ncbi:hypothetical protein MKX01_037995 [Papaver californicum]|nr:hypothetical protein MKX01_037995 [Papaver californicum]